jgi:hypothetical protein
VQAVHALVRHARHLVRKRPTIPCALDFVLAVGETVHESAGVGHSTWPVDPVCTVEDLRQQAVRREWLRSLWVPGDLLIYRDRSTGSTPSVGVVLALVDQRETLGIPIQRCLVAVAHPDGARTMRLVAEPRWCSGAEGDQAVRWFATASDVERAA